MMRLLTGVAVVALLATGGTKVAAQGAAGTGSSRAVATRVLNSLATRDAAGVAREMHPDALQAFKSGMSQVLSQARTDEDKADAVSFFQGVSTFDQILTLTPERFFQAYMAGVFVKMRQAGDVKVSYNVLGEVPEGASQMHVVYRGRVVAGTRSATDVSILTLQKTPAGWKALLTDELRSMAGPGVVTGG